MEKDLYSALPMEYTRNIDIFQIYSNYKWLSASLRKKWHSLMLRPTLTGLLICINLPPVLKTVIPEATLIGNPASNRLKSWIPDKNIRG